MIRVVLRRLAPITRPDASTGASTPAGCIDSTLDLWVAELAFVQPTGGVWYLGIGEEQLEVLGRASKGCLVQVSYWVDIVESHIRGV